MMPLVHIVARRHLPPIDILVIRYTRLGCTLRGGWQDDKLSVDHWFRNVPDAQHYAAERLRCAVDGWVPVLENHEFDSAKLHPAHNPIMLPVIQALMCDAQFIRAVKHYKVMTGQRLLTSKIACDHIRNVLRANGLYEQRLIG